MVSPLGAGGGGGAGGNAEAAGGARFTFAEGAASHHDTHADLAAALPAPHAAHPSHPSHTAHPSQPHHARAHDRRQYIHTQPYITH